MARFSVIPNLLPQNDPRYRKWRKSLKNRPAPWCKGFTKETHISIAKMVRTFKKKKIDNFKEWRLEAKNSGILPKEYNSFKKDGNLAELIGVVLGDGYIGKFPRTEVLTILSNSNNEGFVNRYAKLVKKIFKKSPSVTKRKKSNCVEIKLYQKEIGRRLCVPFSPRRYKEIKIPKWIIHDKANLKRYLRGLYEAEGSFCVHEPTCTYKFLFSNRNESLRENVYKGLKILGFHPHRGTYQIQVSRKKEVYAVKNLIKFRQY